jgi:hypothetical protein
MLGGMRAFLYRRAFSWMISLACAGLSFPPAASAAQALPGNAQLGMSAEQLHEAIPALKRIAHPARMTGGLLGSWSGPSTDIAGVSFVPTFFFAEGELRRVEYVAQATEASTAFDAVRAWGRAQWGAELASQNPEGAYATWASDDMDVYLQMTGSQPQQLRLVIKRRLLKDASEL